MVTDKQEIEARIIGKLLRNQVVGSHAVSENAITAWFPSHQTETVQNIVDKLIQDPDAPLERVRGFSNPTISLTGTDEAVSYLESIGGDVPWGFQQNSGLKESDSEEEDSEERDQAGESDTDSRIANLENELEKMDEASEDWRAEARRRQRLSLLFGFIGFIVGLLTSGVSNIIF